MSSNGIHGRRATPKRTDSPSTTRRPSTVDDSGISRTTSSFTDQSRSQHHNLPRSAQQVVSPRAELHFARLQQVPTLANSLLLTSSVDWGAQWASLYQEEALDRRRIKAEWAAAIPFAFYGLECLRLFAYLEECSKVVGHIGLSQLHAAGSVFGSVCDSISTLAERIQHSDLPQITTPQKQQHADPVPLPADLTPQPLPLSNAEEAVDDSEFYTERESAAPTPTPLAPSPHQSGMRTASSGGWRVPTPPSAPPAHLMANLSESTRGAITRIIGNHPSSSSTPVWDALQTMHCTVASTCEGVRELSAHHSSHLSSTSPVPSSRDLPRICDKEPTPPFSVAELLDRCYHAYHASQSSDPLRQADIASLAAASLEGIGKVAGLLSTVADAAVQQELLNTAQRDALLGVMRDQEAEHAKAVLVLHSDLDAAGTREAELRDKAAYLQQLYDTLAQFLHRAMLMLQCFDSMLSEATHIHFNELRQRRNLEGYHIPLRGSDAESEALTSEEDGGGEAAGRIDIMIEERRALQVALTMESHRYWQAVLDQERAEWGSKQDHEDEARKAKASDTEMRLLRARIKDLEKQLKEATSAMVEAINDNLATEDTLREVQEGAHQYEAESVSLRGTLQRKSTECTTALERADIAEAALEALKAQFEEVVRARLTSDERAKHLEKKCADLEAQATARDKQGRVDAGSQCDSVGGRMRLVLEGEGHCVSSEAFLGRRLEPVVSFGAIGKALTGLDKTPSGAQQATLRSVFERLLSMHPVLRGLTVQALLRWGSTEGVLPNSRFIPPCHLAALFGREVALKDRLALSHTLSLQQLLRSFAASKGPAHDGVARGVVLVVDPFRMVLVELPMGRGGTAPVYSYAKGGRTIPTLPQDSTPPATAMTLIDPSTTLSASTIATAFSHDANTPEPRSPLVTLAPHTKLVPPPKAADAEEGEFGTMVQEGSVVFGAGDLDEEDIPDVAVNDQPRIDKYKSIKAAALVADVCHRFADAGQRRQRRRAKLNAHRERACGRTPRAHNLKLLLHAQRLHPGDMGERAGQLGVVATFSKSAAMKFSEVCASGEVGSSSPSSDSEVETTTNKGSASLANAMGGNKTGTYQRTLYFGCGRDRDAFLALLHGLTNSSVVHLAPTQQHRSPSWVAPGSAFPSLLRVSCPTGTPPTAIVIPPRPLAASATGWLHNVPADMTTRRYLSERCTAELVPTQPDLVLYEAVLGADFEGIQTSKLINPLPSASWDVSPLDGDCDQYVAGGGLVPARAVFGEAYPISGSMRLPTVVTTPIQTLKMQVASLDNRASYNSTAGRDKDVSTSKERPLVALCDVFEFFDATDSGDDNSIAALVGGASGGELAKTDGLFASPLTSFRMAKKDSTLSLSASMRLSPSASSPSSPDRKSTASSPNNASPNKATRRIVVYQLPSSPQVTPPPPPFASPSSTPPTTTTAISTHVAAALGRHIPQCAADPNNPPCIVAGDTSSKATPSNRSKAPPATAAHEARLQGECNCVVVDFTITVLLRKWTTYRPPDGEVGEGGASGLAEEVVYQSNEGTDSGSEAQRHTDLSQLLKQEVAQYLDPSAWTMLCHFCAETRLDTAAPIETSWVPAQRTFKRLQTIGAVPFTAHFTAVLVSTRVASAFTNVDCKELVPHLIPRSEVAPLYPLPNARPIVFSSFLFAELPMAVVCGALPDGGSDLEEEGNINATKLLLYSKAGGGEDAAAAGGGRGRLLFDSTVSAVHTVVVGGSILQCSSNSSGAVCRKAPRILHIAALHPILEMEDDHYLLAPQDPTSLSASPNGIITASIGKRTTTTIRDQLLYALKSERPSSPYSGWWLDVLSYSTEAEGGGEGAAVSDVDGLSLKSTLLNTGVAKVPRSGTPTSLSCCTSHLERVLLEPIYLSVGGPSTMVTLLGCMSIASKRADTAHPTPTGTAVSVSLACTQYVQGTGGDDAMLQVKLLLRLRLGGAALDV